MYRHRHQDTLPLSWDNDLHLYAQAYAEELARTDDFEHSDISDMGIGENLFFASNTGGVTREGRCTQALDSW